MNMTDMIRAAMLMGYGLLGVFGTLIIFYLCVKIFMKIAARKDKA